MELALYCPDCGYYEKENDTIGRRGDFYTSVSVGPLFGELLAFQFAEWLEEMRSAECGMRIVEAGAHDGRLAGDILNWLQLRRPAVFERMEYWIAEPSERRQARQEATLRAFGTQQVKWVRRVSDLPKVRGVIFANELLDALPVQRLGWDATRREWFEWGVALDGARFVWTRSADSLVRESTERPRSARTRLSALRQLPPDLLDALPDGFTTEICPAAADWWREASGWLQQGKLLTLDYGLAVEEFFAPQRTQGTLRGFHRHRLSADVLAHPGEQDLTAHVNFSAIQTAGETAGLKTDGFVSQAQFLTGIAQRVWQDGSDFGPWTGERTHQFQTLTHPEHLGRAFRVLVQSQIA